MITEDYVSFEIAKLLNEKGFDEYCWYIYMIFGSVTPRVVSRVFMSGERSVVNNEDIKLVAEKYGWEPYSEDDKYAVLCPSLQTAMKWLREEYKIFICIVFLEEIDMYGFTIEDMSSKKYLATSKNHGYQTYEEACEAAIKYCLERI